MAFGRAPPLLFRKHDYVANTKDGEFGTRLSSLWVSLTETCDPAGYERIRKRVEFGLWSMVANDVSPLTAFVSYLPDVLGLIYYTYNLRSTIGAPIDFFFRAQIQAGRGSLITRAININPAGVGAPIAIDPNDPYRFSARVGFQRNTYRRNDIQVRFHFADTLAVHQGTGKLSKDNALIYVSQATDCISCALYVVQVASSLQFFYRDATLPPLVDIIFIRATIIEDRQRQSILDVIATYPILPISTIHFTNSFSNCGTQIIHLL